MVHSVLGA